MTRSSEGPSRIEHGFTLVELLVAVLIAMTVIAAVLGMASQGQRIFRAQAEQADLQQRARVAVDVLRQDLLMAGAGTYAGPARGPLNDAIAPVMPYRAFGDVPDPARGVFFRRDAMSIVYVSATSAQSTLAAVLPPGSVDASLSAMPNCPEATATQVCGFEVGSRAMVYDDSGQWDVFTVDQTSAGVATLRHRGTPAAAYESGSAIVEVKLATYYLKVDTTTGTSQLMRFDGWASDQPVVDDVVALRFDYFGEAEPPRRTAIALDSQPGPWTTYGPKPPAIGADGGAWAAGENCTFLVVAGAHVPRLPTLAEGGRAPVELTPDLLTDGPWCPNAAASNRFDADLLRVRKVRVSMRLQSAIVALRGPAGPLFSRGGIAGAADMYVPDLHVQFDVTPRNLFIGR